jgi:peptidoglycan/xylan/chitin deacetylase (PgdA/CDA1 family)
MNHTVRTTLLRLAGQWVSPDLKPKAVVFCYHSIHPTKSFSTVTPELFERHIEWLKEHCDIIPFQRAIEVAASPPDRPAVSITFDDGYSDNYDYALPVLCKHEVKATFFLTVGLMERDPAVVDRFQGLRPMTSHGDIRPLEWSQVREMEAAGMSFGAHTYSHPNLALLNPDAAMRELKVSKDIMEQRLCHGITTMAYPFGKPRRHFTSETLDLVSKAGYQHAAAVLFRAVRPNDSVLAMPRFVITRDDLLLLRQKLCGSADFIGLWQQRAPLWLARLVSRADFAV